MKEETISLPAIEEIWWQCQDCRHLFWDTIDTILCIKCNSENIVRNKLLSANDVVERLGVNHSAVYGYIESGKLKAHRLGGSGGKHRYSRFPWRIWEVDLLDFIESGKFTLPKRRAGVEKADTESRNKNESQGGRAISTPAA